jgi:hypothetical protein
MRHFFWTNAMTEEGQAPEADESTAKRRYKKLTPTQRAEAIALWKQGDVTMDELVDRYGCTEAALRRLFMVEKVKKGEGAREVEAKRIAVMQEAMQLEPGVHAQRVYETKDETYQVLRSLRKLVIGTLIEAKRAGKPLGAVQNDMKAIREAAAAVKICREEAFAVLGIREGEGTEEALPELHITGLDDEQIEQLRAEDFSTGLSDMGDEDGAEPRDVIEGDEDEE